MKRKTKISKTSKESSAKLQRKLWVLCRLLVRKLYGNECYTCGKKNLTGYDWQTGHLLPKSTCGAYLKYDIRILRPQCTQCNIWHGGEGAEFLSRMLIREGQEYVDQIFRDKQLIVKGIDRYQQLLSEYKLKLEDLS